ncbi:hypothetical protein J056_002290 [Wallemia ichthyophaga EXF-994]|uniref:PRELI/MSF1 domain-containing protein n=1 Tax=Wallemia ichthyophaga (strain EXF-994 / CBS 113033) TaxID=1299270 RepID=R9APS4_WALI9|nr:uncharacterized protein J056_002290 [Wallemia ichthyophaga EXF-994]EOR04212.1 hypothetical protein J056_002290 [Wallemia ichthyophaga EXF-994]
MAAPPSIAGPPPAESAEFASESPVSVTPSDSAVDVLSRSIDAKTGDVTTERLIGVEQAAPLWAIKLFNCSSTAFVIERLTVSPQLQRTTARSVNLSLSDYLKCDETITYTPHPSNPALATLFSQTAQFTSAGTLGWKMAEKKLEEHSVRRFSENAGRGREGFEFILRNYNKI